MIWIPLGIIGWLAVSMIIAGLICLLIDWSKKNAVPLPDALISYDQVADWLPPSTILTLSESMCPANQWREHDWAMIQFTSSPDGTIRTERRCFACDLTQEVPDDREDQEADPAADRGPA